MPGTPGGMASMPGTPSREEMRAVNLVLSEAQQALARMSAECEAAQAEATSHETRANVLAEQFRRYVELTEEELAKAREAAKVSRGRVFKPVPSPLASPRADEAGCGGRAPLDPSYSPAASEVSATLGDDELGGDRARRAAEPPHTRGGPAVGLLAVAVQI